MFDIMKIDISYVSAHALQQMLQKLLLYLIHHFVDSSGTIFMSQISITIQSKRIL